MIGCYVGVFSNYQSHDKPILVLKLTQIGQRLVSFAHFEMGRSVVQLGRSVVQECAIIPQPGHSHTM
jgi:hypothetical protein